MKQITKEFLESSFKKIPTEQSIDELKWLCDHIYNRQNTKVIVELGVRRGGTLRVWEELLSDNNGAIVIT